MSPPDHVEGEMHRFLDHRSADALLDGRVAAADAPPGFQDVARLVQAARAPAHADELAGEAHAVAALAAAVGEPAGVSGSDDERRRPMLTRLLTAKMAAAAAAAVLGGGAAAAATGSLPSSLQSTVSHGLSSVGISVPDPSTTSTGGSSSGAETAGQHQTPSTVTHPTVTTATPPPQAVGPSATGPALYGLCTAYASAGGTPAAEHSVAFRNLLAAATAAGESVTQYCAAATPGSSTTPPTGSPSEAPQAPEPSTPASTDHATSSDHPSGTPPATTAGSSAGEGDGSGAGHPSGTPPATTAGSHGSGDNGAATSSSGSSDGQPSAGHSSGAAHPDN